MGINTKMMRWAYLAVVMVLGAASVASSAPRTPGEERSSAEEQHWRQGRGGRAGHDEGHRRDMEIFHYLLDHGELIDRQVEEREDGVETWTESGDPEVAAKIQEHVLAMVSRVEQSRPIHRRDPLFAELFEHAGKIIIEHDMTERGIHVVERSDDPYVAKLIKAHAEVVSRFVAHGRSEMREDHPVPERQR